MCPPGWTRKIKNQAAGRRQASYTTTGMPIYMFCLHHLLQDNSNKTLKLNMLSGGMIFRQAYSGSLLMHTLFPFIQWITWRDPSLSVLLNVRATLQCSHYNFTFFNAEDQIMITSICCVWLWSELQCTVQ